MMTMRVRRWGVVLALVGFGSRSLAHGVVLGSAAANVASEHIRASTFLDSLAGHQASPDGMTQRERMAHWASVKPPQYTKADFERAGKIPYEANHVAGMMGVLAAVGQAAVGTSQQAFQAAFLQKYADLLNGNSNSNLAKVGQILGQEATCIANGDQACASNAAQLFQGIVPEAVPSGYLPTGSDQSMDQGLVDTAGYDWGSMWMALGQAVMAAVAGFIQGGWVGAIVALVLSLVVSFASGSFTSQTHQYSSKSGQNMGASTNSNANSVGMWGAAAGSGLVGGFIGKEVGLQGGGGSSGGGATEAQGTAVNVQGGAANIQMQAGKGVADTNALAGASQTK